MSKAEKGVMNPYVSAKFGRYTKGDACRRIPRISGIVCKDGKAADVDFEKLEGMRTMLVPRAAGDDGVCYVDVWHDIGGHFGQHIGCAQIDVSVMTEIPAHGVGKEETLSLYDEGAEKDGGEETGQVKLAMKWHGESDRLALQIVCLKDLKDVSEVVIADSDSFHDNAIMIRAMVLFFVYLLAGTAGYDLFFRACDEEISEDNRMLNSTTSFIGTSITNPTDIGNNAVDAADALTNQGCSKHTSWMSFLDAMVFQFTSFTTVGYGTHPVNFQDNSSMLLTSLYILVGMAIMGILAGAIGETLIRQVELTTSQMAMVFEDTVEFGVNAGVGTVNAAGAVVVGTASAVSSIVPSGSPRNGDTNADVVVSADEDDDAMTLEEEEEEKADAKAAKMKEMAQWASLFAAMVGMIAIVLIGTFAYMYFDGRTFVEALYFTIVTVTTVGFGDVSPEGTGSKVFSIIYIPVGVVMFASAFNTVSGVPLRRRAEKLESYVLNQFLQHFTRYDLGVLKRSVDLQKTDDLSKNDFTLAMLLRLGKIKAKDLEKIEEVFFQLDVDKSGVLDQDDVDALFRRQKEYGSPTNGDRDRDAFEADDDSDSKPNGNGGEQVDSTGNPTTNGGEQEQVDSTENPLGKRLASSDIDDTMS